MSETRSNKHWDPQENLNYFFFLIIKADLIVRSKGKLSPGFFADMSEYIPSRNKNQCRTHHHKMLKNIKITDKTKKTKKQILNLKRLYYTHITLRQIEFEHLKKQIIGQLAKKVQKGILTKQVSQIYFDQATINLKEINFQQLEIDAKRQPGTKNSDQLSELSTPIKHNHSFQIENMVYQGIIPEDLFYYNSALNSEFFYQSERQDSLV